MVDLLNELAFIFQRFNWLSSLDLFLVTMVFFSVLLLLRDTQAIVLLRGVLLLVVALILLTSLVNLPAFSWLIQTMVPTLVLAIPVIFAPEIRRGLERLGRAGSAQTVIFQRSEKEQLVMRETIQAVVSACARLSARQHGALIVLQRGDSLQEYVRTGVRLNARITPELLLQIFYPNTPLHDGAAIVIGNQIAAAACVMPLSASGILNRSPERQMGLRHRAALGTSEASDAVAVVVSEESGSISIAHGGRMIRRLDSERLENILQAFYQPPQRTIRLMDLFKRDKKPPVFRPGAED
ncbi:MAG: diadenylate cyclase CdaA [Bellilinea sp.]